MARQRHRLRTARLNRTTLIVLVALSVVLGIGFRFLWRSPESASELGDSLSVRGPVANTTSAGPGKLGEPNADSSHPLDSVLALARKSLQKLDGEVKDYTVTIVKRERIDGRLADETHVFAKIIDALPANATEEQRKLHVYLRFELPKGAKGREVLWVDGWNQGKLMAHEAGMLNVMRASLDPSGMVAMMGNRYPISDIGLRNLLLKLIEKGERDRKLGPCLVTTQPNHKVGDRTCDLIQVSHPEKKEGYDFHVAQIFFDPERLLPLRYASYSWPTKAGEEPPLEEEYTYLDLKLNVGLSEDDFSPDNPQYTFPK